MHLRAEDGGLDGLAPGYAHYPLPAGAPIDVELTIVRDPGVGPGRPRSADYPAFTRRLAADGAIVVERYDAMGELRLLGAGAGHELPLVGTFTVGAFANSLEACVRIALSIALPRRGGVILHGSAVAYAGGALAFTGISGAGKSTISALLDGQADPRGAGFVKIVDELCVLAIDPGRDEVVVHTAPFLGIAGLPLGRQVPLRAIHFLRQALTDSRAPVPERLALGRLLGNVLAYVADAATAQRVLDVAAEIVARVPCFELAFAKSPAVARVFFSSGGTVPDADVQMGAAS